MQVNQFGLGGGPHARSPTHASLAWEKNRVDSGAQSIKNNYYYYVLRLHRVHDEQMILLFIIMVDILILL
jgi:hypothetical protein